MPFVSRSPRQLANLAWPALIAALMMIGFTSAERRCPLTAPRCECASTPKWSTGWSTNAEQVATLVFTRPTVSDSTLESSPNIERHEPLLADAHHIPRALPTLRVAPKTSPPR